MSAPRSPVGHYRGKAQQCPACGSIYPPFAKVEGVWLSCEAVAECVCRGVETRTIAVIIYVLPEREA